MTPRTTELSVHSQTCITELIEARKVPAVDADSLVSLNFEWPLEPRARRAPVRGPLAERRDLGPST
eukprot:861847-Pyramimonas_sp.AAC.1